MQAGSREVVPLDVEAPDVEVAEAEVAVASDGRDGGGLPPVVARVILTMAPASSVVNVRMTVVAPLTCVSRTIVSPSYVKSVVVIVGEPPAVVSTRRMRWPSPS